MVFWLAISWLATLRPCNLAPETWWLQPPHRIDIHRFELLGRWPGPLSLAPNPLAWIHVGALPCPRQARPPSGWWIPNLCGGVVPIPFGTRPPSIPASAWHITLGWPLANPRCHLAAISNCSSLGDLPPSAHESGFAAAWASSQQNLGALPPSRATLKPGHQLDIVGSKLFT